MSDLLTTLSNIRNGDFDNDFATIRDAIRRREKSNAKLRSVRIRVGDRVMIGDNVSPAAFRGLRGTITAYSGRTRFDVKLDNPPDWDRTASRYMSNGIARGLPAACVREIE
jgi:hypothetical protein